MDSQSTVRVPGYLFLPDQKNKKNNGFSGLPADPRHAPQVGVNASADKVLDQLIASDTANAFNISLQDVNVTSIAQASPRFHLCCGCMALGFCGAASSTTLHHAGCMSGVPQAPKARSIWWTWLATTPCMLWTMRNTTLWAASAPNECCSTRVVPCPSAAGWLQMVEHPKACAPPSKAPGCTQARHQGDSPCSLGA